MKNFQNVFIKAVSYFFILLFFYAAASKIMDFENFQVQIGQSPLLTSFATLIAYSVIVVEIVVCLFLAYPKTNMIGLYASLALMSAFTIYIFIILNYSEYIPCSCGGILEKMTWTQHLVFNIICVVLSVSAIIANVKTNTSIIAIPLSIVLPSALVVGLYFSSESVFKNENNFTRRYFPNALIQADEVLLDHQFYYFAGIQSDSIFLGDITSPLTIKVVRSDLEKRDDFKINLDSYGHLFKNLKVSVKDSFYYLSDGSVPIIYRGNFNQPNANTVSFKQVYFNHFMPIDTNHFAFRTISAKTKSFTLGTLKFNSAEKAVMHPDILTRQSDGIFDSDGMMISSYQTDHIIYTYAYRNQFIITDKNLNIKSIQKTIDTTTVAQVRAKTLSDGRTKMSAPPFKVNKLQTAVGHFLFNQSDLIGKNESAKRWKSSWSIDVYDFEKKQYVGSFYIPHQKGDHLTGLLATKEKLYVLSGNRLTSYDYRDYLFNIITKGEAENLSE